MRQLFLNGLGFNSLSSLFSYLCALASLFNDLFTVALAALSLLGKLALDLLNEDLSASFTLFGLGSKVDSGGSNSSYNGNANADQNDQNSQLSLALDRKSVV